MQVLAKLLWHFSYRQLEAASPLPVTPPPVVPPRSPPTVRSLTTTVVVKGEVSRPRPLDPFKETVVGRHGKVKVKHFWRALVLVRPHLLNTNSPYVFIAQPTWELGCAWGLGSVLHEDPFSWGLYICMIAERKLNSNDACICCFIQMLSL
jgi:hypothetical protein